MRSIVRCYVWRRRHKRMSNTWQVFVKSGTNGKSWTIILHGKAEGITILAFKELVAKKTGFKPDEQYLEYGGEPMKDNDTLADYPRLKNRSTINLTGRLLGGGKNISRPRQLNNDCNFCYTDPSIMLPCKHNYCVDCLIKQVKSSTIVMVGGRPSFKCQENNCKSHWDTRVLGNIDNLTDIDFNKICTEIAEARTHQNAFVAECPGCLVLCQRPDVRTLRVQCPICHKKGKPDFCWECKQPWKGSGTSYCGNEYCSDILTKTKLLNAPLKKAYGVEIRSVRMCPNCHVIIEHKDCCRNVTCKCGLTFCFRCLIKKECKKDCQLAPIQTVD